MKFFIGMYVLNSRSIINIYYIIMANMKSEERDIRKLTCIGGGSVGLTLPIEYVRELGWRERQKVVVKKVGKKLIITDMKSADRKVKK